jgi:PAS domain S-box-containing protein
MKAKKINIDDSTNLRQRAEEALQQQPPKRADLSAEEVQQLIHELQVHQIELEMQNEELRQAQLRLEESHDKYVDLYDFAPVGYFTISDRGLILEANLTGTILLGVARSALLKQPFSRFIARDSQERYYWHRKQMRETGIQQSFELTMVIQTGVSFEAQLECSAAQHSNGTDSGHFRVAVIDVTKRVQAEVELQASNHRLEEALTELKKTQAQIVQQERLAVVGQLAAGIAHDFNNLLTGILGFAELTERLPDTSATVKKNIMHIKGAGERAANLVRQILDFSRKSIQQPQQLDLAAFVQNTVEFFRRTIPENIYISVEIEPGEYLLRADPTQLQQVLTNLAVNARDAMPEGGRLTIQLLRRNLKPGDSLPCEYFETPLSEWLVLSVSDTGVGIPTEVLPHIFEPFFTTKEVGQGTGLGLAQVYGIVRQHDGCLDVSSQEGQGATFTVYLPGVILKEKPVDIAPAGEIQLGLGQTILLVEDEPVVLQADQAMLIYLNYRVLTATNGNRALAVYAEHKDEIALVLTDIVMPEMDGTTLFEKLKAKDSTIKVIMMTGYPLGEKAPKSLAEGVANWLYKPTSMRQLARIVNETLQQG